MTKHGLSKKIPEYGVWANMKSRCSNPNDYRYHCYGAKGIVVCDEWINNFSQFLEDMGNRPTKEYSLDRIDSTKNYCKENCKWSTEKEQQNNRTNNRLITFGGKTQTASQWAEELSINYNSLRTRFYRYKKLSDVEILTFYKNRKQ